MGQEDRKRLHQASGAGVYTKTWKGADGKAPEELWQLVAGYEESSMDLGLPGLAVLQGREAVSRVVVDRLLLPLCAKLGVVVSLEETFRRGEGNPLPSGVCDYTLRRGGADGPLL